MSSEILDQSQLLIQHKHLHLSAENMHPLAALCHDD